MRFLVIICLCLCFLGFARQKCDAQVIKGLTKKSGQNKASCSLITIFVKSKTILEMGNLAFCADVALNKNSLPYSSLDGNLLKQYHGSAPIYGSLELGPLVAVEGGAYLGLTANRPESMGERPLPSYLNPNYSLGFDSGLVSGLSFNLEKIGRLRLRYNYGISNLVDADDKTIKTRRLDLGLNFKF